MTKKNIIKLLLLLVLVAIIGDCIISSPSTSEKIETVTYNEFLALVDSGSVDTIYYNPGQETMIFTLFNDETQTMSSEELAKYEYSSSDKRETAYPGYENA